MNLQVKINQLVLYTQITHW